MRIDTYNDFLKANKDCSEEYLLEQKAKIYADSVQHKAILYLLAKFETARQAEAEARVDRRHQESILESRASRRLDKWALSVAVVALLVGGAGLWRSFPPSEPARLLPAPASSAQVDRVDPIAGIPSKPSTEPAPKPTLPKK